MTEGERGGVIQYESETGSFARTAESTQEIRNPEVPKGVATEMRWGLFETRFPRFFFQ